MKPDITPQPTAEEQRAAAIAAQNDAMQATAAIAEKEGDTPVDRPDASSILFYAKFERFLVQTVATEAAVRAQTLLEHSKALRILVNTHLQQEGARAFKRAHAGKEVPRHNGNPNQRPEGDMIEAAVAKCGFLKPLVVLTTLNADGAWREARVLDLGDVETDKESGKLRLNGKGSAVDAAAVDQRSLHTAMQAAKAGASVFVLICDALERTSHDIVCRHVTVARVAHNAAAAELMKIKDAGTRIKELCEATRLEAEHASSTIEDLRSKREIAKQLITQAAERGARLDPSTVTNAPLPSDSREALEIKYRKLLAEGDLNKVLNQLTIEANGYQSYLVSSNLSQILVQALVRYPKILEHVDAELKLGHTEPIVLTVTTKSGVIDESNYRITYTPAPHVRELLAEAKKSGKSTTRYEQLVATLDRARASGADCILLEIINYGVGIVLGVRISSISVVDKVLGKLGAVVAGHRAMLAQARNYDPRTQLQKDIGVQVGQFEVAREELLKDIEEVAKSTGERIKSSNEEWETFKQKAIEDFRTQCEAKEKEMAEKAAAATTAAAQANGSAESSSAQHTNGAQPSTQSASSTDK